VDLFQFTFRPIHGILGLHALDRLGVHVRDVYFENTSVAFPEDGPAKPKMRVLRAAASMSSFTGKPVLTRRRSNEGQFV
jgi:hypothetical protein